MWVLFRSQGPRFLIYLWLIQLRKLRVRGLSVCVTAKLSAMAEEGKVSCGRRRLSEFMFIEGNSRVLALSQSTHFGRNLKF